MGRKRTVLEPKKVTMLFHLSSYQRMAELYPGIGAQAAIRALVHAHVQKADAKLIADTEALVRDLELGEIDG